MLRKGRKIRDREGKSGCVCKVAKRLAEKSRERKKRSIRRVLYKKLEERRRERKKGKMHCYYGGGGRRDALERIERLAGENAVVVFSISSCCMCHVVKRLFCSLGVSPTVHELDEVDDHAGGQQIKEALAGLVGDPAVPAVFIGGKLVGGLDCVMATHISGNLVPLLKEAGALWL